MFHQSITFTSNVIIFISVRYRHRFSSLAVTVSPGQKLGWVVDHRSSVVVIETFAAFDFGVAATKHSEIQAKYNNSHLPNSKAGIPSAREKKLTSTPHVTSTTLARTPTASPSTDSLFNHQPTTSSFTHRKSSTHRQRTQPAFRSSRSSRSPIQPSIHVSSFLTTTKNSSSHSWS